MQDKVPRFKEENQRTTDRWKKLIAKEDGYRLSYGERYGYLVDCYAESIDELTGVKKDRRFVSSADLERSRVPITAWNRLPVIPGPAPQWFKTKFYFNESRNIGYGVSRKSKLITLDYRITNAGLPDRKRGDIFDKLGWPPGSVS